MKKESCILPFPETKASDRNAPADPSCVFSGRSFCYQALLKTALRDEMLFYCSAPHQQEMFSLLFACHIRQQILPVRFHQIPAWRLVTLVMRGARVLLSVSIRLNELVFCIFLAIHLLAQPLLFESVSRNPYYDTR